MTSGGNRIGRHRLLGVDLDVTVDDPALRGSLAEVIDPFRAPGRGALAFHVGGGDGPQPDGEVARYRVTLDGTQVMRPQGREQCLAMLIFWINQRVVSTPSDRLLIHASVAALGRGALVFPGASGAGKSTLVAGLVRAGLGYLSDELAPIRIATTHVDAYPRAITLEQGSWGAFPELERRRAHVPGADQWYVPPAALRPGCVTEGPLPVVGVIFPTARPGATTRIQPLPRAEGLARLGRTTFNLAAHGPAGFATLATVLRSADVCLDLVGGSIDAAVDGVLTATSGLR